MKNGALSFICIGFVCFTLNVQASNGDRVGNGGDGFAQEFVAIGRKIVEDLRVHPDPNIKDFAALTTAVENTKVETKDSLTLNMAEVDAINRPEEHRIEINRKRWKEYDTKQKTSLALHEYLGISQIKDDHYQISGAYTELTFPEKKEVPIEAILQMGTVKYGLSTAGGTQYSIAAGYEWNHRWTTGLGYTYIDYSMHAHYLEEEYSSHTIEYTVFGKYYFNENSKLRAYSLLGVGYWTSKESFVIGTDDWYGMKTSTTLSYPARHGLATDLMIGLNYQLSQSFSADASIGVKEHNLTGQHLQLKPTGLIGVGYHF